MADKEIGDLTVATLPLTGTELIELVQGGNSRQATAQDIADLVGGGGDMLAATYDPTNVAADAFDQDNMADGTTNKNYTATEKTKLAGIEAAADVTDAGNVGAVLNAAAKGSPVDADRVYGGDSTASFAPVYATWTQTKAFLKTYFDTLYAASGGTFTAATTTDVLTGTDTAKGVTADALAALWEKGADVASASTVSLGEGGFFHITGTTTITDIDWATAKDGRAAMIVFDGILTLTHNATTLILPGGASIVTAAGDTAIFVQDASDNVKCIAYVRASGKPLIPSIVGTPFELEVAISDETTSITTGTGKIAFYAPMDATISEVFTGVSAQSTSGLVTIDLNKNGSTMFSTNPSIDANEDTSLTAATPPVLGTTTWTKGDKMTIDIDAAGTGAKGLKAVIRGTRL